MVHRKRQGGFLQSFVVPGIILIGVVISALMVFTRAPDSGKGHAVKGFNANLILADATKLEAGLQRAQADGLVAESEVGTVNLATTLLTSAIMAGGALPAPPLDALTAPANWQYSRKALRAYDAQASAVDVGSSAKDDVLSLANINADTCAHINYLIYGSSSLTVGGYIPGGGFTTGTSVTAPQAMVPGFKQANAREGCVSLDGNASNFVYYKVVGVR